MKVRGMDLKFAMLLNMNTAEFTNTADVVPKQIHDHRVFGTVLIAGEKLILEHLILL